MNLIKTSQRELSQILPLKFDLMLCATGYESRASYLVKNTNLYAKNKYVFSFNNHSDLKTRLENDKVFKNCNFTFIPASGNDESRIFEILTDAMREIKKDELNILVDYSSMTRIWYAAILQFVSYSALEQKKINLYFVYSFSAFTNPPEVKAYNKYVGPIEGFYSINIPIKPSALIIGLGYIETRAYGLAEYFDVEPYLFIADSSVSQEFYDTVRNNNREIINSTRAENIFQYPLDNLSFTEALLSNLCSDLKDQFRIVLAPCGPKPFTLLNLISALRYNFIDVWRISAGESEAPQDKRASGKVLVLQVSFSS